MAQENNVNIPDQISWTKDTKEQTYRGVSVKSRISSDPLNVLNSFGGSSQPYGGGSKNAAQSQPISFPSDISGGPIDITYGGIGSKSNYPVMQPIGNKIKQKEPIIQVIGQEEQEEQEAKTNISTTAPLYDGFQPHYAHYSKTMNPIKMLQTVQSILSDLEQNCLIDFYQKSPFVYTGRAYGLYNDCEFLLSIFSEESSDESSECIVEIRRSSGESFEYANIENSIVHKLKSIGAIVSNNETETENDMEDDDDNSNSIEYFGAFGFGFGSLPSLDTMELDSNFSGTDMDENDNKCSYFVREEINLTKAKQLLQNAVDLQSMRDVLRSDIAHLNEQMAKNENIFKTVPDIINIIINSINDDFYDCWGIKMYLGMISKLISLSTPIPTILHKSIINIQMKWSHVVINQVAPGVKFEFYPSQQIVRCCQQIINQIK